jgi:hypothetical protein
VLPDFCKHPPADNDLFWFAVGEGPKKNDAINDALNQIASKISIHVNSNYKSRSTETNKHYRYHQEFEIEVHIDTVHFHGYEIVKKNESIHTCYVLVKVDKEKYFKAQENKFLQHHESIKQLFHQLKNMHVLAAMKCQKHWHQELIEADKLANILDVFDHPMALQLVKTQHYAYRDQINNLFSSVKMLIKHSPDTRYIASHIKSLLTEKNIPIVHSKKNDLGLVILDISDHTKKEQIDNDYFVKLSINIRLQTALNTTLAEKNYSISGNSLISFDTALQNASKRLKNQATHTGILNFLGIK